MGTAYPDYPTLSKQEWPPELQAGALDAFYGNPRGSGNSADPTWERDNIVHVTPPWPMSEDGSLVKSIAIHKRCADSLSRILAAIWEHAGHDQATIDRYHLNEWGGSFNYRANVNSPSKLSLHAYGAAVDVAPDENPNDKTWKDDGTMLPRWAIDAFLAEGWCWGGDFSSTKDPMHFQATLNTHDDAPQDQPVGGVSAAPPPSAPPSSSGVAIGAAIPQVTVPMASGLAAAAATVLAEFDRQIAELQAAKQAVAKLLAGQSASGAPISVGVPVATPPPATTLPPPTTGATQHSAKGSWYSQHSGKYQWVDKGDAPGSNALGVPDEQQGIALPQRATLGKWFLVTAPNGVTLRRQQTDIGPGAETGRGIDIAAVTAEMFGYSPNDFPTDGIFQWVETA